MSTAASAAAANSLSPPVNAKIKEIQRIVAFSDSNERHRSATTRKDNERNGSAREMDERKVRGGRGKTRR